jgi:UDP-3-O-[3-hydroxymyristoyl] glucosamine N-acyltransferase
MVEDVPLPGAPPERRTTVGDIAALLGAELIGNADTLITGVAAIESARPGAILFIENEHLLKAALASSAAAIIAPSTAANEIRKTERKSGKPTLLTGNPRLAFAKVMEFFQPLAVPEPGIHPTAIIEPDAHLGEGVTIREFCYVGHHTHIGDGSVIYPHVVIGDGAQIGDNCTLYPSVVINHHVHIGHRVRVHSGSVLGGDGFGYVMDEGKHHKVPQVGTVIVEDDVEIGANVCIDRATMGATRIGAGSKIDNLVQIAHNVQIGRNCIICALAGISGSVVIEDNVIMAGQVGVADHMKIGKGAVLAAKAGVMTNIAAREVVVGSPATPHRDFMKREAASRKLPEGLKTLRTLEKRVRELEKQLGVADESEIAEKV